MRDYQREYRRRVLNKRLNESEAQLRKQIGSRKVGALIKQFKAAAKGDPGLYMMLYRQPDPYGWVARLAALWQPQPPGSAP